MFIIEIYAYIYMNVYSQLESMTSKYISRDAVQLNTSKGQQYYL